MGDKVISKSFSLAAVLGVTSGIVLGKFSEIHDVLDFFYPGIMTHEIPSIAEDAKAKVLAQYPEFEGIIKKETFNQDFWDACGKFTGPITLTKLGD